ncbi:MAG: hypothetical protein R3A46_02275 [Thermomicrobiales bacterium]
MSLTRRMQTRSSGPAARIEQFFQTLTHRHSDDIDRRIQTLLANEQQWQLVARLSAFDRAHLLRVHDFLVARGLDDPDLLRAALLHDVGKSNGVHQVRLWDRTARVLGRRWVPNLWRNVAKRKLRFFEGLYLAEYHARIGAAELRSTGVSRRCLELVMRHEESPPTGDRLLDALIHADEAV